MPAGSEGLLFAGTTTAPARDFVAEQFSKDHERIVLPCVGRWAVATAVARRLGAERIYASDLCLFSTLIGYMADPTHDLDELGVTVPERYEPLTRGSTDDAEWAAGVMLAVKLATLSTKNVHGGQVRSEVWSRRGEYRRHVAEGLREQVRLLKGCHYDVADVRVIAGQVAACGEDVAMFVNLPGYKGGYTKLYGQAEAELWPVGTQLAAGEFDPAEALGLLSTLSSSAPLALAYVHHGDWAMPAGWVKLAAFCGKANRTDYIIGNRDTTKRLTTGRYDKSPARWPVFTDDDEITPDSEVGFVTVDKWTCLHYRDLFVHRLGQTESETYGLMLLDGKVVTAFGLHSRDLRLGRTEYLYESFGISVSSMRYARLGKLFMLLLTSRDFKHWLMAQSHAHQTHTPIGIKTASPTLHHEGKTDRSVMKLVSREELSDGTFQLVYAGLWQDRSWSEALNWWLERWGSKSRPGWTPRETEEVAP